MAELEKENKERKKVSKEKEDLEAELENLTQILFEEVRRLLIVLHLLFGPSEFMLTDTFPSVKGQQNGSRRMHGMRRIRRTAEGSPLRKGGSLVHTHADRKGEPCAEAVLEGHLHVVDIPLTSS
jgi:hypothetical protein